MFVAALFALAAGAWLLDSAVQNRNPVTSLLDVIRDPANARTTVAAQGSAFKVERSATETLPDGGTVSSTDYGSGGVSAGGTFGSSKGDAAVAWARTQIGKPYKWGATGPDSYDCSGLVQAAYKSIGVSIPRTTATQQLGLRRTVSRADLAVGDLVYPDAGHVGIYSGNGMFIEAPRAGKNVREVKVWGFLTARRVV